jgi:hypothetical protein
MVRWRKIKTFADAPSALGGSTIQRGAHSTEQLN